MAYCFLGYKSENVIKEINFSKMEEYRLCDSHKMKDILFFTHKFVNVEDLKLYLEYYGFIERDNPSIEINIYRKKSKDDKPQKLPYGLSFKDDEKYFSEKKLEEVYSQKMSDFHFLESIINRYLDYFKGNPIMYPTVTELYYCYNHLKEFGILPEDARDSMKKFVKKYVLKKDKYNQYIIDYNHLRELAMFYINYKRKNNPAYKIDEIENKKIELLHYREMIKNSAINEEQEEAYLSKIEELRGDINGTSRH